MLSGLDFGNVETDFSDLRIGNRFDCRSVQCCAGSQRQKQYDRQPADQPEGMLSHWLMGSPDCTLCHGLR